MDAGGGSSKRGSRVWAEDLQRIERYLAGELAPVDVEAFELWVASDPTRQRLLALLAELWDGDDLASEFDVQAMWARTLPRVRERRRVLSLISREQNHSPIRIAWLGIPQVVAAALLLASLALAGRFVTQRGRARIAPILAMRNFSTRRGQRANLQLDDGTQVVLGAATTVQIPDDYGDSTRNIFLDGEAYFVVKHDPARPFAVHAGHAVVRDIGTQFAVTAYFGAPTTRVVVAEGEVSVAHTDLRPRDVAIIDSTGQSAIVRHQANVAVAIGWAEGRLAFEAAPFRDVVASLSRWYDLDIQLADSALGYQPLTVTFGSESTHQVLDALALLTHTRYEQHGRTATFYAGPRS